MWEQLRTHQLGCLTKGGERWVSPVLSQKLEKSAQILEKNAVVEAIDGLNL